MKLCEYMKPRSSGSSCVVPPAANALERLRGNVMGGITAGMSDGPIKAHLIDSAQHMRLLTLGVILLLVLRFSPRGLIPEK